MDIFYLLTELHYKSILNNRGEQHELLVPPLVADGDFYLPSLNSRSTTTRSTVPLDDLDRREIDDQQLLPEIDELVVSCLTCC